MKHIKYFLMVGGLTLVNVAQADASRYVVSSKAQLVYPDGASLNITEANKTMKIGENTCYIELSFSKDHSSFGPTVYCQSNQLESSFGSVARCSSYTPGDSSNTNLGILDSDGNVVAQFFLQCETTYTRVQSHNKSTKSS